MTTSPLSSLGQSVPAEIAESVTLYLAKAKGGDAAAWDAIYALLYRELHKLARSQLWRSASGHTLTPTALINETWLRLVRTDISAENRKQFVGLIAHAMRAAILDETRRRLAEKRGGGVELLSLSESTDSANDANLEQMIALDCALDELAQFQPRLAQIVEWRFFGGVTEPEISVLLGLNIRTVQRDWRTARVFLLQRLGDAKDLQILNVE